MVKICFEINLCFLDLKRFIFIVCVISVYLSRNVVERNLIGVGEKKT